LNLIIPFELSHSVMSEHSAGFSK